MYQIEIALYVLEIELEENILIVNVRIKLMIKERLFVKV